MTMLTTIAWVSLIFAVRCFAAFAGFVVLKLIALYRESKEPVARQVLAQRHPGMAAGQQGLTDAPEKVIDSLARLTDSMAKAPMSVVAIIGAVLFMLIALSATALECSVCAAPSSGSESTTTPPPAASLTGGDRRIVTSFADGDHRLPGTVADLPAGCLDALAGRVRNDKLSFLLIIGHSDIRDLTPRARRVYGDNLTLAQDRQGLNTAAPARSYSRVSRDTTVMP